MSALLASPLQNPMMAAMDSSSSSCLDLELHQYAQWQEWAMGARRSEGDLMDDIVDEAAERHLYIPLKQAAIPPSTSSSSSADLGDEELVMRVVQFFSNIHANTALRRLGIYDNQNNINNHCYPFMTSFPQEEEQQQVAAFDDSFTSSSTAAAAPPADDSCIDDAFLTELGMTPSLVAEQQEIWNQAKNQQQQEQMAPVIPEWLHQAAQQDGRRIRVVTVDTNTETNTVKCIGCNKLMVAAKNIDVVFCPHCGCTFCPDILAPPAPAE